MSKLPLGRAVFNRFLGLPPHPIKCQATYVWIDGSGENLREKTRTLPFVPKDVKDFPDWTYDGSSTEQASGHDSDLCLKPVAIYRDPFLGGQNRLVLCATYDKDEKPTKSNHREECKRIMDSCAAERPWFGMEQEYLMLDQDGYPLGWPKNGFPAPQGPYYCSVGADRMFGREVIDAHYRACLHADIEICGTNAEVTPGQAEYQIGICEGISMGDQLWMARYLMDRTAEQFGVSISLHPKPLVTTIGEWNGAGCHANFSSASMRAEGGIKAIKAAMPKLEKHHQKHLEVYDPRGGEDNLKRLSGKFETSSVEKFTWGVGDRSASVRIQRSVEQKGRGWFEDRRPASNCDPYCVTAAIAEAVLL